MGLKGIKLAINWNKIKWFIMLLKLAFWNLQQKQKQNEKEKQKQKLHKIIIALQ